MNPRSLLCLSSFRPSKSQVLVLLPPVGSVCRILHLEYRRRGRATKQGRHQVDPRLAEGTAGEDHVHDRRAETCPPIFSMIISERPMASGAKGLPLRTVRRTVSTRNREPMHSVSNLDM